MHFHFSKKTLFGFIGLLLVASLLAYPGALNVVEGG